MSRQVEVKILKDDGSMTQSMLSFIRARTGDVFLAPGDNSSRESIPLVFVDAAQCSKIGDAIAAWVRVNPGSYWISIDGPGGKSEIRQPDKMVDDGAFGTLLATCAFFQ